MLIAPLLKLRSKVLNKGKSMTVDQEKPFLEHLDDLRKTIMRIVTTLTIAVIVCFVFNEKFFELIQAPIKFAGLDQPSERKIPSAIKDMEEVTEERKQEIWWHIHGTARGMADLEGAQRDAFLQAAAKDDLTRQMAQAVLFYHVADALPKKEREGYIAKAAALLPEADRANVVKYAAQLTEAETPYSLEKPRNFVEMEAFAPAETFMLSMKLSLYAGIIVSFPLLFFFLLEFVLPGLTGRERKLIFPALAIGFGLFLAGVCFAYFVVVPQALQYFHEYSIDHNVADNWRIGLYISFVTSFVLLFGLVFETPVVIMIMVKLGLLTSRVMRNTRGYAIVIMLVAAAVITPTGDMLSMSLMAGPMIIMYEICIWLAVWHERKVRRLEAEEQRQDQARRAALIGVASVQAPRPGSEPDDSGDGGSHTAPDGPDGGGSDGGGSPHGFLTDSDDSGHQPGAHPHHPEESPHDSVDDYSHYLKNPSQSHYSTPETHPESVPVEERPESQAPVVEGESAQPVEEPAVSPPAEELNTSLITPEPVEQELPAAETATVAEAPAVEAGQPAEELNKSIIVPELAEKDLPASEAEIVSVTEVPPVESVALVEPVVEISPAPSEASPVTSLPEVVIDSAATPASEEVHTEPVPVVEAPPAEFPAPVTAPAPAEEIPAASPAPAESHPVIKNGDGNTTPAPGPM